MEALHKIRKEIDTVLSSVCVFLFAAMVVVGTYQIVTRFVFNSPSTVSEELLTYSFAWMAMFASAYVFGKRDHMKMSFVVDKLPADKRRILDIVIEILIVVFAAAVLIYGGFTIMNLTMTQKTASLGISQGVVYAVMPISGILVVIYGLLNIADMCTGNYVQKTEE